MDTPLVVVTGFGAFEEVASNPSGLLAEQLMAEPPAGVEVLAAILPVSFRRAPDAFDQLLASLSPRQPDLILSLGVCPGPEFRIELRAATELSQGRPDVDGQDGASLGLQGQERRSALDPHGLQAAMVNRVGPCVRLSEEAGGYVCERIYHHALGAGEALGVPALFLHVLPAEQMSIDQQLPALRALALAALGRGADALPPESC